MTLAELEAKMELIEKEQKLNIKEIVVAFKRLKNIEIALEKHHIEVKSG